MGSADRRVTRDRVARNHSPETLGANRCLEKRSREIEKRSREIDSPPKRSRRLVRQKRWGAGVYLFSREKLRSPDASRDVSRRFDLSGGILPIWRLGRVQKKNLCTHKFSSVSADFSRELPRRPDLSGNAFTQSRKQPISRESHFSTPLRPFSRSLGSFLDCVNAA